MSPILSEQLPLGLADLVAYPADAEQIAAVVAAATRHRVPVTARGKGTGNRPTKYILSALAYCAVCGARLIARPAAGRRAMQCSPDPRDDPRGLPARKTRGHVRVVAEPMERLVIEAVMQAVEGGKLASLLAGRRGEQVTGLRNELATVETKLNRLSEMWAADQLGETEWKSAREPLTVRRVADDVRGWPLYRAGADGSRGGRRGSREVRRRAARAESSSRSSRLRGENIL